MKKVIVNPLIALSFLCACSSYAVDFKDPPPAPAKVLKKVPVSTVETYNSSGVQTSSQTTYEWKTSGGNGSGLVDHGNFKAPPPAKVVRKTPVRETVQTGENGTTKTIEYKYE